MKMHFIFFTFLVAVIGCSTVIVGNDGEENLTIGERFQKETSLSLGKAAKDLLSPKPQRPPQYKEYSGVNVIPLPEQHYKGIPVEEAIRLRRSVRSYSEKPIALADLGQLLFAAQGVTARTEGYLLRSAPSAGALYPVEIYVFVHNVADLEPGIYHYNVREHALEQMGTGDFRKKISHAAFYQGVLGKANATLALAAVFDRTRCKYGERGYRYVYLEAGHISQNIYLQAVSLGLGSVAVGAFRDDEVNKLIGLDGQRESVLYLHAVGTL